jgi:hypothetical protein
MTIEGRGTPVDNRGGWLFPSKLPPLEAEAPPKGPGALEHHAPQERSMARVVSTR